MPAPWRRSSVTVMPEKMMSQRLDLSPGISGQAAGRDGGRRQKDAAGQQHAREFHARFLPVVRTGHSPAAFPHAPFGGGARCPRNLVICDHNKRDIMVDAEIESSRVTPS